MQMSSDLQDSLVEFVKGLSPKQVNLAGHISFSFLRSVVLLFLLHVGKGLVSSLVPRTCYA